MDMKTKEALDQIDRLKALEFDLQKTIIRNGECEKVVEARSFEIRSRQQQLDDTEKEIARLKDLNNNQALEAGALRKDVDRVSTDCYDLRKHIEGCESKNVDLSGQIRSTDIRIKERDEDLYVVKRDIEGQVVTNSNMRGDMNANMQEKEALERHSRVLLGQNDDLTRELERFVNTDEVLRQQLDRRGRVVTMQEKNNMSIGVSAHKVYEVRSRSPARMIAESKYPEPISASFAGASTAVGGPFDRSSSPPRRYMGGGSPLRSSYRPTYSKY